MLKNKTFIILILFGAVAALSANGTPYIPLDKNLDQTWVASLSERGERRVYQGDELNLIGMPCGGIGAGQMEVSGVGRLGTWWIFNVPPKTNGGLGNYNGARYLKPASIDFPVENGFAIHLHSEESQSRTLRLDGRDFNDIRFIGEYPIASLEYCSHDFELPVQIDSEIFSPFVPLNVRDSANPVTVLRYTVRNRSDSTVDINIGGWLENPNRSDQQDRRLNRVFEGDNLTGVQLGLESEGPFQKKWQTSEISPADTLKYGTGESTYGNLSISMLGQDVTADAGCRSPEDFLKNPGDQSTLSEKRVFGLEETGYGTVTSDFALESGESRTITFIVSWFYPNLRVNFSHWLNENPQDFVGRLYSTWYSSSAEAAGWVADNHARLFEQTELFRSTYHETTLPYWLANRISMPVSTLACENITLHQHGRLYAFEGVSFCFGTCGHVYNFVTAIAKLFPSLERSVRLMQDFNESRGFDPKTGRINFRGHDGPDPRAEHDYASDAQSGYILKAYREHLHSPDMGFLKNVWPKVKLSMHYQIFRDGAERSLAPNGVLESKQTFWDPMWWGPNPYNNTLYLAALRAAETMARLMDEDRLANRYHEIYESGRQWMLDHMWNGEYFVHLYPEGKWSSKWNGIVSLNEEQENAAEYVHAFGTWDNHYYVSTGCDAQQTFGQNWAHQLGLGYILPAEHCKTAAASIFKYNWTPDIKGVYDLYPPHNRTLAASGEAAMVNGAWPKVERQPFENIHDKDDIWTGLEYQAACDMINEGLLEEALIMIQAIDARYDAVKRNPWNEIEGAEHYSRAMHAWNVLLALSGFDYDGPQSKISFSPKISPDHFQSFFSGAEGWGTYSQTRSDKNQSSSIFVKYGKLLLKTITLDMAEEMDVQDVVLHLNNGDEIMSTFEQERSQVIIKLSSSVMISAGHKLQIDIQ